MTADTTFSLTVLLDSSQVAGASRSTVAGMLRYAAHQIETTGNVEDGRRLSGIRMAWRLTQD